MMRLILLIAAVMMTAIGAAPAATLTDSDYRYLRDEYALAPDNEIIRDLSADELAKLHELINAPFIPAHPSTRDLNVGDFLFEAHMRECSVWALSHGEPECPPTSDAAAEPGKEIADRQCNACHLFGTMSAPAFFQLAREGKLDEQRLAAALDHGHTMSPIALQPEQIRQLIVYIRSLK